MSGAVISIILLITNVTLVGVVFLLAWAFNVYRHSMNTAVKQASDAYRDQGEWMLKQAKEQLTLATQMMRMNGARPNEQIEQVVAKALRGAIQSRNETPAPGVPVAGRKDRSPIAGVPDPGAKALNSSTSKVRFQDALEQAKNERG